MLVNITSTLGLPIDSIIIDGIAALLISIVVTGILIPRILLISYRKNLFDVPDRRKIHSGTVPRLGGMAFMPAIVLSLAIVAGVNFLQMDSFAEISESGLSMVDAVELCFGLCALMAFYLVGLADDLIGVKYRAKFVVQIACAMLLTASGLRIDNLEGFLGIYELTPVASEILTVMVVLLVVNAINLIDGIDGLASGLSAIGLAYYAFISYNSGAYVYTLVALASLGTLIPFYYYNVFGSQERGKKIFMGDTGALTSGLLLSLLAIKCSTLPADPSYGYHMPLALAFSPLVVPCLDVLRVFIRRIRSGRNPFEPGRTHIHHKFLALGLPQRLSMVMILALSAGFILMNVLLSTVVSIFMVLAIDIVLWTSMNILLTRSIYRRRKRSPEGTVLFE